MKKLNNSNFELLEDIIKTIDFNYDIGLQKNKELFCKYWAEIVGDNISQISKVYDIQSDGTVIIVCENSYVANELFMEKENLICKMIKKTENMGITIKDIKFDYRKWKELNNEKEI